MTGALKASSFSLCCSIRRSQARPHRAENNDHQRREGMTLLLRCPDSGVSEMRSRTSGFCLSGLLVLAVLSPAILWPAHHCACDNVIFPIVLSLSQPFPPVGLPFMGIFTLSTGSSQFRRKGLPNPQ